MDIRTMIKAKFYVKDLMASLKRLNTVIEIQKVEVPKFMASDYANTIKNNIVTKKYNFVRYSKRYQSWKESIGKIGKGFFRLNDNLLNSVTYNKVRITKNTITFFSGVPGGKEAMYGERIEKGKGTQGKRPLFGVTYDVYIEGKAKERVNRAGNMLESTWR